MLKMKFMIAVLCMAAVAMAAPTHEEAHHHQEPAPFVYRSTSDVDGSYAFSYAAEDSSKTETRSPDGTVVGGYKYIDTDGKLQTVQYKAGVDGVELLASNLPVGSTEPVKDTPEVLQATEEHYHEIQKSLQLIARARALEEEFRRLHPELVEKYQHHE